MFGFLLKIVVMVAVVSAIGGVIYLRRGNIPNPQSLLSEAKTAVQTADTSTIWNNLSGTLDSLVSKPNSPVVLGISVTNDSLNKVVDVIQDLPPDQLSQIQSALCQTILPTSTPTPAPTSAPQ